MILLSDTTRDLIGVSDGGEAVGDGDGCTVFGQIFQTFLDPALALIIQGACGLIQNKDRRVFKKDPGDGNTLLLSAGQACAPLAHKGIIAVGKGHDKVMNMAFLAASMISSMEASGLP